MFNIISNAKTRDIIHNMSLEELVNQIKNPTLLHKKTVDIARSLEKGSKKYNRIKLSLPCFIPNYTHKDFYVKSDTAEKSTGFLYIDLDESVEVDFSKFNFVAAAWKSLSGIGKSIIVSVSNMPKAGCSKEDIAQAVEQVSNSMNIPFDKAAISRDRIVVIPYDTNVYYNPNYLEYNLNIVSVEKSIKQSKQNNFYALRLSVNDTFHSDTLRFSNLEELTENITFESDEVFKDFSDNKILYADVYVPSKISEGNRNESLFKICSKLYGLNPNANIKVLYDFMLKVNSSSCEEPMFDSEVLNIVNKVFAKEPILYSNKKRSYIFNPDYMLTGSEKRSIAVTASNKRRGNESTNKIYDALSEWDFEKYGKVTYEKIAEVSGISRPTIARRGKNLREIVKNMNNSLVKSL